MTADTTTPCSRRSLLTAAAGGAAAAVATTIARAAPVAAEGENIKVGGEYTTARSRTFLKNSTTDRDVLVVTTNGRGRAVWAKSTSGVGVKAESVKGIGLWAQGREGGAIVGSKHGDALRAVSETGVGLRAESFNDVGLRAEGGSGGVYGSSEQGPGLAGFSERGYGLWSGGRVRFDRVSGVATIPAGARSVVVDPGVGIDGSSFVLLTPKANIGGRGLWFTTNRTADTFRIRMSSARPMATRVAWLLVG